MEPQIQTNGAPSHNGQSPFIRTYPESKSTLLKPERIRKGITKSDLIDGGEFDWRLAYWFVAFMWVIFSYTQSVTGVLTLANLIGFGALAKIVLCVSVSGAEGVIVAWLTCPQRNLVSKRQEKNLRFGSYAITFFQVVEIGLLYAYKLSGGMLFLWLMGMSAVAMLVTALLTVKNVIQHSEGRQKTLEDSDTRIEESIANAKIRSMEARHRLQAKKSIIDIEAEVLRRERMQTLNALNTKEARDGISKIGQGRAQAVIEATAQNMQNYAVKMLLEGKPANAPVNPRSLNGAAKKPKSGR